MPQGTPKRQSNIDCPNGGGFVVIRGRRRLLAGSVLWRQMRVEIYARRDAKLDTEKTVCTSTCQLRNTRCVPAPRQAQPLRLLGWRRWIRNEPTRTSYPMRDMEKVERQGSESDALPEVRRHAVAAPKELRHSTTRRSVVRAAGYSIEPGRGVPGDQVRHSPPQRRKHQLAL